MGAEKSRVPLLPPKKNPGKNLSTIISGVGGFEGPGGVQASSSSLAA